MIDRSPCISEEVLVTYVYDECEASERDSIAAHVASCAACTTEVRALRDTRAHLGAWLPPSMPLGFQMTRTDADAPATVLRPAARVRRSPQGEGGWWRQPLPAWAQAAAAAVIFAAGMMLGAGRAGSEPQQVSREAPPARVAVPVVDSPGSRAELARFERRLQALEAAPAARVVSLQPSPGSGSVDRDQLMTQMRSVLDERIAELDGRQLRVLASLGRELESRRKDAERIAVLEEVVLDHDNTLRTVVQTPLVRAAFQTASVR